MSSSKCEWENVFQIVSREYTCYFCNKLVASDRGYRSRDLNSRSVYNYICICPHCTIPTTFTYSVNTKIFTQVPKPLPLSSITGVKDDVKDLFEEVRRCMSTESYTAVAMICRKLLMNIAVDHGAEKNQQFQIYVEYIQKENLVSKSATELLKKIKNIGNDANHEIPQVSKAQANLILQLTNEVINQIYRVKNLSLTEVLEESSVSSINI